MDNGKPLEEPPGRVGPIPYWFAGVFISGCFIYIVYTGVIRETSNYSYTIATFKEIVVGSKTRSRKFIYSVNGKVWESNCSSKDCIEKEYDERVLIVFYHKDHSIYELFTDHFIPNEIESPAFGWKEIPKEIVQYEVRTTQYAKQIYK